MMSRKQGIFFFLLILSYFFFGELFAATPVKLLPTQSNGIDQLNQQINVLKQAISADQGKKGHVAEQLNAEKEKLTSLEAHLATLQQKLSQQQSILSALQTKQHLDSQAMHAQRDLLSRQFKVYYMSSINLQSDGDYANEQDIDHDRFTVYAGHLNTTELNVLNSKQLSLTQISNQQQMISQNQQLIKQSLNQQQASQLELAQATQTQQMTLQKLSEGIETESQKLTQLIANRAALENLVQKIQKKQQQAQKEQQQLAKKHPENQNQLASAPEILPKGEIFSKLQGELIWPLKGRILTSYGAALDQSGLKSTGVLLSAKTSVDVHAVYQGKVVFSGWLQGLGLLMIIDHGDGYITLYGRNHALYKKVGDVVKTHDLIAQVDTSGEQHPSGLYFEIRHEGQPLDPATWCRG